MIKNFIILKICYIPTVSKFAAYKMKEADLFYVLSDMISSIEWRDRAIHTIACWAKFDQKYIDQQLVSFNERTEKSREGESYRIGGTKEKRWKNL